MSSPDDVIRLSRLVFHFPTFARFQLLDALRFPLVLGFALFWIRGAGQICSHTTSVICVAAIAHNWLGVRCVTPFRWFTVLRLLGVLHRKKKNYYFVRGFFKNGSAQDVNSLNT